MSTLRDLGLLVRRQVRAAQRVLQAPDLLARHTNTTDTPAIGPKSSETPISAARLTLLKAHGGTPAMVHPEPQGHA